MTNTLKHIQSLEAELREKNKIIAELESKIKKVKPKKVKK